MALSNSILFFLISNSTKIVKMTASARLSFQKAIKGTIFERNIDAHRIFEIFLPTIVLNNLIYSKTEFDSFLNQLTINHGQKISVSKKEIIDYLNKNNIPVWDMMLNQKLHRRVVGIDTKVAIGSIGFGWVTSSAGMDAIKDGSLKNYKDTSSGQTLLTLAEASKTTSFFSI